jgi:hypothetical protein
MKIIKIAIRIFLIFSMLPLIGAIIVRTDRIVRATNTHSLLAGNPGESLGYMIGYLGGPLILLLLLIWIFRKLGAGCQTSQQMSLLPLIPPEIQSANVYLMRPRTFFGDTIMTELYLDGHLIAQLAAGCYTVLRVSAGTHMIALKVKNSGFHSQIVNCESGKECFFRTVDTIKHLSAAVGEKLKYSLNHAPLN